MNPLNPLNPLNPPNPPNPLDPLKSLNPLAVGLLNFRDAALAADPGGTRVRRGVLYRSAQPFPAADSHTADGLRAADVRTVIDLRSAEERRPEDWQALRGAGIEIVEAPLEAVGEAVAGELAALRTDADLGRFYASLAEAAPDALVAAVGAAARPGAALVHCAAGKDRTGLLTALLLELLGVPDESIADDYVRTADELPLILAALAERVGAGPLNRLPGGGTQEGVGTPGGGAGMPDGPVIPAPLLAAPRVAILTFLRLTGERHGGAGAFLRGCGVLDGVIEEFRAKAGRAPAATPSR
ncbi:tyrosine-protein phosphatase [Streptomyces sp. NPDC059452]|uniref:tyrosine-protein phosphatase n=1 Tax=Streptomyces sp. NPDC059452 TaxID=3346835 RepID=UPI003693BFAA